MDNPLLPSLKTLPSLAVFSILDSSFLRTLYLSFYCLFAGALLVAFTPYIFASHSILVQQLSWFGCLQASWIGLWFIYKSQCAALPVGTLAYENSFWIWQEGKTTTNYLLAGEVLCWPWLIILPLKNVTTGRKRYVLLAGDALGPADQARLRTWLRACLKPKG